ncbi:MAG: hypothetical protein DMF85_01210 [Acidobacteria bacterium]|nr:MAG: hypothetical protein DMF85_01210 [Acidobacteriota bacterium]
MDTTLVIVTLVSLAIAVGLGVVVWRFYREDRRRTDARIAALTELALEPETHRHLPEPQPVERDRGFRLPPPREATADRRSFSEGGRAEEPDLPLRPSAPPAAAPATLFQEQEHASPWGARFVVMAGLGLATAAIVLFALTARNSGAAHAPAPATTTAPVPAPGLELLSLRDTRQNGTLTITGLVQNPRDGAALSRVVVTAFAFDRNGSFLASGRAPLDYTTLQPGDESPFVVTVPASENVARYRIGFRGEDGRVIAHVDRRQAATAVAENRP